MEATCSGLRLLPGITHHWRAPENEQSKSLHRWSERICVDSIAISIHYDVTVVPDFLRKIKRMCKQWIPGSFFSLCPLRAQLGGYLVPRKDKNDQALYIVSLIVCILASC